MKNTVLAAPPRNGTKLIDTDAPMTYEQDSLDVAQSVGLGSPGNNSVFATGPSTFDDTKGLRSAMSTSHEKMNAELLNHMPTQLPKFEWEDRQDELCAKWESQGLPPCPGSPMQWDMPDKARVASW